MGKKSRASWPLMPAEERVADGETMPATETGPTLRGTKGYGATRLWKSAGTGGAARAELMGMFAWTSELLQPKKHATFRRPGVNVTKLFDAKELSVMSCSAGVVGSAKKFSRFSAKKTILFGEKSTSDPAM